MMMNNILNALFMAVLVLTFVFGAELGVKSYVASQATITPVMDVGQATAERP
jgi:hypothetical protein